MKNPETAERISGDELLNEDSTVQNRDRNQPKARNGPKCKDEAPFAGGNLNRSGLAVAGWNAPGRVCIA